MTQVEKLPQNSGWLRFLPDFVIQRLSGRHKLQAILGNSAWQVADKIVRMGVGVLVGLWVARYLGPHRFGQLNYAIALSALFGAIANLGLDNVVIRELVRFPERKNILLGSTFALKLVGAFLSVSIVTILVSVLRPGDKAVVLLTFLSAAGFLFQSVSADLYFQSKIQSKYIVLSADGAFLLMALAKVVLILIRAPLVAFAWAGLCELALAGAFLLIAYNLKDQSIWRWKCDLSVMRALLKDSWPLIPAGISVMIAMRVDQVMIGQMLNDREVGLYSVAVKVSELWYFIPIAIAASTYPALVEAKNRSEELYYGRLQKLYNLLVTLAIAVAVVMSFLSGPLVRLLYGQAYAASDGALRILIWSGVPVCFGCAWSNWMILENRMKTLFLFQMIGAVVNLTLNLLLIPRFGIRGSALATLISYWVWITILSAIVKSQHRTLAMFGRAVISFTSFLRIRPTASGS
jgi:PST family polysaccharide transporter